MRDRSVAEFGLGFSHGFLLAVILYAYKHSLWVLFWLALAAYVTNVVATSIIGEALKKTEGETDG